MHEFISETAKYGDLVSGPRVITADTKQRMKEILGDINPAPSRANGFWKTRPGARATHALLNKDLEAPPSNRSAVNCARA